MKLSKNVFLALVFSLSSQSFSAQIVKVPFSEIHPTQPTVGYATIEKIRQKKFKNVVDEETLQKKLQKQKIMPAVKGPGGILFLTDGHHRTSAAYRASVLVCGQSEECMQRAQVYLEIVADQSGSTWSEFADFMLKNNNVYLSPMLRKQMESGEISREMILKKPGGILPDSLANLKDEPIRSAMSEMFDSLSSKVDGDHFVNYTEFYLGEKVASQIEIKAGHELESEVLDQLKKLVFNNPETLHYLRCLARQDDANWAIAQEQIDQVVGEVRTPDHPPFRKEECSQ